MTTSAGIPVIPAGRRPATGGPVDAEPSVTERRKQPRADCIADSAGGLTFDIADRRRSGSAGSWDSALVLTRRGGTGPADALRLPLVPAGDGRLRAVLPSTVPLPEGRWDAHWVAVNGDSRRLVPGVNDLRSLVDRQPAVDRPSVAARIPYATKHGNLSVRGWQREPHAEAGEILVKDGAMTVRGRFYGPEPGGEARAEVRCRRAPGLSLALPLSCVGNDFSFTLPYEALLDGGADAPAEEWELWLRPSAGAEAARIARILDDVPDKKHIFNYPVQTLTTRGTTVAAGPYYTADNDLAVRLGTT
ncbi:hypothetical protein [Streptomyces sp. TP-A0874]|uniref:hypothetical protein n=1 Tax=Streptomyces sp. TP-A0874 TaxID=549819 RepID=UPI000A7DF9D7|nr:hypothetical protein [Streptomyces sp. TP-A0874]